MESKEEIEAIVLTKDLAWYIYSSNNPLAHSKENKQEFEKMWDNISNKKDIYIDENGWEN